MLKNLRKKGFFDLLSVNFLTQFLGFGSLLLVAKFLTPAEFGQIKIIQSYAVIFILLAGFGFNTTILKLCSENRSGMEKEFFLKIAIQRSLITTFFVLILVTLLSFTDVISSDYVINQWMLVYCVGIPFAALTGLLLVYLQAQKKTKQMARAQAIIKLQSALVIILCTWIFGFKGFIYATVFSYIIGLIPLLKQTGTGFIKNKVNKKLPGNFMHIAVFSLLANFVSMIGQYADIFILGHFSQNLDEIGYYSFATIFILGANQVTGTVQTIATPFFSERGHDENWFRKKLLQTQLKMAALSIGVAIGVYAIAWIILQLFFNDSYMVATSYLLILLIKYIVWSSCSIIGVSLVGLGLMRHNFFIASITTTVCYASSYYLFVHYGIIGVAWAQVVASLSTLVLIIFVSRIALRKYYQALI